MADKEEEYPLGTAQEHALMCEKHDLMPIDVTCEDCEEFICSKCVKEDHKDHDWITISTAAILKTRGLMKSLKKIEEEDIQELDKKIQTAFQQMEENKKRCKIEVSKLQKHYDAIVEKLQNIKEKQEKTLRESLENKNAEVTEMKLSLQKKKKSVLLHIKSMRENGSSMDDIIWIKAHRELTRVLSTKLDTDKMSDFLLRHENGDINEEVLESMLGKTFDAEQITITETYSFQWSDKRIVVLEAMNEDACLIRQFGFPYVAQINNSGKKENEFSVDVNDVCVTDNNEVYVPDWKNKSISRLSPSDSVYPVFSADPLRPEGICQTKDGGLLISLADTKTGAYQPNSNSRRLVRHVTLAGDVIREYEYQADSQTRLFTFPNRVKQNGNTDICVINWTSITIGELVVLSFSGSLKSVYPAQGQRGKCAFTNVVCDSHCNIILSELQNNSLHLLSPDGEFLRYLLTENQVNGPTAMSLKKSTLWIGDFQGLVKVFQYKSSEVKSSV